MIYPSRLRTAFEQGDGSALQARFINLHSIGRSVLVKAVVRNERSTLLLMKTSDLDHSVFSSKFSTLLTVLEFVTMNSSLKHT